MHNKKYDIAGVGNAIVDILSFCEDTFLTEQSLAKGGMTLIDDKQSAALYNKVGQATECSGGSVANTLAGMASLGAKTAFVGKLADDTLGSIFTHDMRSNGTEFTTAPITDGVPTANCIVLVTPDAQRTMATYIGACSMVSEADIEEETIKNAAITYIEGYLWDTDDAKAAIRKAMKLAKKHGNKVALTLSDTFCVIRHREEFHDLITNDVDILFANEDEINCLFETQSIDEALFKLQGKCEIAAVTRGPKGCVVVTDNEQIAVECDAVSNVVDTTGAGDLFAAGFLFGQSQGHNLEASAKLGNKCAGHIIQQLGARSQKPLKHLAA